MRVAVIIPCHIHYKGQLEKLLNCINSLKEQTHTCTIIIGISFASNEYYSIFKNKVFPLVKRYVKFIIQREQTYQIMHIYNCLQKVNDHDYILFCDDDDTYHTLRTQQFMQTTRTTELQIDMINETRDVTLPKLELAGVYENISQPTHHTKRHEYWCYCIRMDLLTRFFNVDKS